MSIGTDTYDVDYISVLEPDDNPVFMGTSVIHNIKNRHHTTFNLDSRTRHSADRILPDGGTRLESILGNTEPSIREQVINGTMGTDLLISIVEAVTHMGLDDRIIDKYLGITIGYITMYSRYLFPGYKVPVSISDDLTDPLMLERMMLVLRQRYMMKRINQMVPWSPSQHGFSRYGSFPELIHLIISSHDADHLRSIISPSGSMNTLVIPRPVDALSVMTLRSTPVCAEYASFNATHDDRMIAMMSALLSGTCDYWCEYTYSKHGESIWKQFDFRESLAANSLLLDDSWWDDDRLSSLLDTPLPIIHENAVMGDYAADAGSVTDTNPYMGV